MKKALALILAGLLTLSSTVFAAPVISAPEAAAEKAVTAQTADLSADYTRGVKPGLNMLNSATVPYDFESDGMESMPVGLSGTGIGSNPFADDVNPSAKATYRTDVKTGSGDLYASTSYSLLKGLENDRPVYVSFKYAKSWNGSGTFVNGGNFWVMKNGTSLIASAPTDYTANSGWHSYAGVPNFKNPQVAGGGTYSPVTLNSILLESKVKGNEGEQYFWFDDILFVPYYKISFDANDGKNTAVGEPYYFSPYTDATFSAFATKYSESADYKPLDTDFAPEARFGYEFLGWSTDPEATDASASLSDFDLKNADITLYAVWQRDADMPEPEINIWDFESSDSQVWKGNGDCFTTEYRNGRLKMTYTGTTTGNAYINNGPAANLDTKANRYLIFTIRNNTSASQIAFYYNTAKAGWAESHKVVIPIAANSNQFVTYAYDMYTAADWVTVENLDNGKTKTTGYNYNNCMFKPEGVPTSGTIEIEEIGFRTVLDEEEVEEPLLYAGWDFEDGTYSGITAWGNTKLDKVEDGVLTLLRDSSLNPSKPNDGSLYVNAGSKNLSADTYKYIVFKCLPVEGNPLLSITWYYIGAGEASFTPSNIVQTTKKFTDGLGASWLVADFSAKDNFSGTIGNNMLAVGSGNGTYQIDEITFTNDADRYLEHIGAYDVKPEAKDYDPYHFDLSKLTVAGSYAKTNNDDGSITVVWTAPDDPNKTYRCLDTYALPGDYPCDIYRYYVLKVPKTAGGGGTYFITSNDSNIHETRHPSFKSVTDDDYKYLYIDMFDPSFTGADLWKGSIKQFRTQFEGTIYDMWIAPTFELDPDPYDKPEEEPVTKLSKFALYADKDTVSEDGGTAEVYIYAENQQGYEVDVNGEDIIWTTDSVIAVADPAGTSIYLTGKINGTMTVTATYTLGQNTYTASRTVKFENQDPKLAANYFKYMSFGNSIWSHGYAPDIGWMAQDGRGMAASGLDKDYVHRFIYYIEQKFGEGSVEHEYGGSLATYERNIPKDDPTKTYEELNSYIAKAEAYQPDIITIQMGENVSAGPTKATYTAATTWFIKKLQAACPDAIILFATSFWGGADKVAGAIQTGIDCGVPVARLDTLGTGSAASKNEAIGQFSHSGVASHPSDTGMDNIAKLYFADLNVILTANDRTEYTDLPKEVIFDTTPEQAVINDAYGSLELKAHVLPAESAQGLVWTSLNEDLATVDNGIVYAVNDGVVTIRATSRYNTEAYADIEVYISGQTTPYLLSYDKNTDDAVSNMPENNPLAKDYYEIDSETIPLRPKYNFVGWAYDPDGEDMCDGYVDMYSDVTLYAIWTPAVKWDFNRGSDTMGFTAVNGFHFYSIDGCMQALATETDFETGNVLRFVSPEIDIDTSVYSLLVITMSNSVRNGSTQIELTVHTTDGDKKYTQSVTSTAKTTYNFDLSNCTGTITGFEFTPTNIDCTVLVDEIVFSKGLTILYDANTDDESVDKVPEPGYSAAVSETAPTRTGYHFLGWSTDPDSKLLVGKEVDDTVVPVTLYAQWELNDHWEASAEGNFSGGKNKTFDEYEKTIRWDINGEVADPIFSLGYNLPNYPVDAVSGVLDICMKTSLNNMIQIFFTTDKASAAAESRSQVLSHSSSDDFNVYSLDLSKVKGSATAPNPDWDNTLKSLRLDFVQNNYAGSFELKYVAFDSSERIIDVKPGEELYQNSDSVYLVVAEDAIVRPNGGITVRKAAINGEIAMDDGYIMVEDAEGTEIGENTGYVLYTYDAATAGLPDDTFYVEFDGTSMSIELIDGTTYILPKGMVTVYDEWFDELGVYEFDGNTFAPYDYNNRYEVQSADKRILANFNIETEDVGDVTIMAAAYDRNNRLIGIGSSAAYFDGETTDGEVELKYFGGSVKTVKLFFLDPEDNITPKMDTFELKPMN